MRNTVLLTGVPIDKLTMKEAIENLKSFLLEDKVHSIYTPNAEILMNAHKDKQLNAILSEGSMVIPDGAGVVLASHIIGNKLPEKVSGIDLVKNSFSMSFDRKIRFFFFGGKPGVAEEAAEKMQREFPNMEVVGCRDGYFSEEDQPEIINQINFANTDILLVALGSPKQEKWIHRYKGSLNCRVCVGVGGSLDIFAGRAAAAPEFLRKNGFEWLYRLYKEPKRFIRMLKLPQYMLLALFYRFKK